MKHITDILPKFKTLNEYKEFIESLAEASGEEISRGKNQYDKSKEQKKNEQGTDTFISKEVKKAANGDATETHYTQADPSIGMPPPEPPVQPLMPGQQVNFGNKPLDNKALDVKTVKIDLTGEKDKIDTNPAIKKNPDAQMK